MWRAAAAPEQPRSTSIRRVITPLTDVEHFAEIEVPGAGPVSMATLGQLHATLGDLREQVDQRQAGIREADVQIEDTLADLGAWWSPPAEFYPWLEEADRLVARILRMVVRQDQWKAGQMIIGYNNLAEVSFQRSLEGQEVMQRLWWQAGDQEEELRMTEYRDTLEPPELGDAPPLP